LILVQGHNYWAQILEIENTAKLFPDLQFVFLHIGQAAQGQSDLPELDNIRQLYARTNSGAVARAFMQYAPGRHPRVYLINRKGKLAGTLLASEHYSEGILKALAQLRQGEPVFDQQTQKSIFLILAGILGGGLIIGFIIHQWQQRLRRREQFERQRISAQLQAIRSQLNPHFMFNSMSSIQHLIRSGQAGLAQSYLGKLAELLRATLRYTRENFISLQEELDVVGQYCELEALRFNFSFDLQVEETLNTRAISIPPLLLQPYVENAVLHGIAPLQEGGRLKMEIREQGRRLWIRIRDNGQGIKAVHTGSKKGNGIGLKLNAERLRLVYGNDAQVNVYSPSPANGKDLGMGTEVQIAVPIDV
jgi:signal transduction histidine kinase